MTMQELSDEMRKQDVTAIVELGIEKIEIVRFTENIIVRLQSVDIF